MPEKFRFECLVSMLRLSLSQFLVYIFFTKIDSTDSMVYKKFRWTEQSFATVDLYFGGVPNLFILAPFMPVFRNFLFLQSRISNFLNNFTKNDRTIWQQTLSRHFTPGHLDFFVHEFSKLWWQSWIQSKKMPNLSHTTI